MEDRSQKRRDFLGTIFKSKWIKIFGDCPGVDEYVSERQGYYGLLLNFINCLTRGISQVSFSNNPFTGVVVLMGLFSVHYSIGLGALVGASVSVLTAKILCLDKSLITSGLTTYNGALVGIITTSLLDPLYSRPLSPFVWGFIVVGSCFSVIFNSCISNLLSSPKHLLPPLTIAFNIIQILIFACLMQTEKEQHLMQNPNDNDLSLEQESLKVQLSAPFFNESLQRNRTEPDDPRSNLQIDIVQFLMGIILSVGQAHGIQNFWASLTIMIGIFIYSPLHLGVGLFGAGLASICGLILCPVGAGYGEIYAGLWGYNGFLASVAIGSIFFLPSFQSLGVAAVNVISAAVLQRACQLAFQPLNLPYLTVPYVLTTLTFLQLRFGEGGLHPVLVLNISFPEKHLYLHYFSLEGKKEQKSVVPNDNDADAEMSCHACSQSLPADLTADKCENNNQ